MNTTTLAGLRVLVVEDEMLVSMLLEDMLADFGCSVVGPKLPTYANHWEHPTKINHHRQW